MESRRLTPPRLDRNRNAHPSAGIGGAFWYEKTPFLHRKNSVVLPVVPHGENARCAWSSDVQFFCLAPRSSRSPSAAYLLRLTPNG